MTYRSPHKPQRRKLGGSAGHGVPRRDPSTAVPAHKAHSRGKGSGGQKKNGSRPTKSTGTAMRPNPPKPRAPSNRPPTTPTGARPYHPEPFCNDPAHRLLTVMKAMLGLLAFGTGYLVNALPISTGMTLAVLATVVAVAVLAYLVSRQHVIPWRLRRLER